MLARRGDSALLYDLEASAALASLPTTHGGRIVQSRGPLALDERWIAYAAVTYARSDARAPEFWDAFIMSLERSGPQGLGPLITLPANELTVQFLELAGDRRHVVAGGDDRFWVVDLEGHDPIVPFTVGKQIAHSLAVSARHDLIAVGLFGKVSCFRLSTCAPLGLIAVDDGNVTHLSIGGDRLVAITEDEVSSILELDDGPPAKWPQRRLARFSCRGYVAQREGSLSPDGQLLATRYKKKDVMVWDLEGNTQQLLRGHSARVELVRFSQSGSVLFTADARGGLRSWPRHPTGNRLIEA